MKVFTGLGVNGGVAIGRISVYKRKKKEIERINIENVNQEFYRFETAKDNAVEYLKDLYKKAVVEVGETNALIFEAHQMMLEDIDFIETVKNVIFTQKVNAEYAVLLATEKFSKIFISMDNEYMKERAADLKDISQKLLSILNGDTLHDIKLEEPSIIISDDLVPSETIQLDRNMVLGFVTQQGSMNSHTAILARTMDIPAVVGVKIEINEEYEGKLAIIDGFEGIIYIDPEQDMINNAKKKQNQDTERNTLLRQLKGKESITLDGKKIEICANIANPEDVINVLSNDADGIGLFRSEFLYLGKNQYPSEEEQFNAYKIVVEKMAGKKVIIRTLDIGADKKVDYFDLEKEENPALGYRAIRICLERTELFKTQLRAIYRASAFGKIAIMFPMIISLEEVLAIKEIVSKVQEELKEEGIPFTDVELGIMIETPAAAIISDILAKEVDFFSIGTNDLTQYTLAIDRQNRKLEKIYNPHHIAILRFIEMIAKNAHANGIWVGICGELASDLTMTETFLRMGIDELSVSPGKVLELRKEVRSITLAKL